MSTPAIFTDGPELLSIKEAAAGLGVIPRTIRHAIKDGSLPAFIPFGKEPGRTGPGHGYRIKREDLHRWYFGQAALPPEGYKHK